jgi:hypothetical protein
LFTVGGFGLFLIFVVVAGHAVLRRARWGAFICQFVIQKWQKGVRTISAKPDEVDRHLSRNLRKFLPLRAAAFVPAELASSCCKTCPDYRL